MRTSMWLLCGVLLIGSAGAAAGADDPIVKNGKIVPRTTIVSFELVASRFAYDEAQGWSRDLGKAGYTVRIRQGLDREEPEVSERMLGRTRSVKVLGRLEPDGSLRFPDRKFKRSDVAKLVEWLEELKAYGAQGAPDGKPVWGLDKEQFDALMDALAMPIEADLAGKTLDECLQALPHSKAHALAWSLAAKQSATAATRAREFPAWQRVQGMSLGSGLALVLNHYDLGFWPARTPQGTIELRIEPLSSEQELWPIGWKTEVSPDRIAPKYTKLTRIDLTDVSLLDVAQAISVQTETPVVFNRHELEEADIDLETLKVSHPPKNRAWKLALTAMLSQHQLTQDLLIDEQGRAFAVVRPRAGLLNVKRKGSGR